jgi:hypothetical protein
MIFDGFEIDGTNMSSNSGMIHIASNASYITVKNCHVFNGSRDADCIKVNQAAHIDVLYCDLHDPGLRTDNTAQETLDYLDVNAGLVKGNLFRFVTQKARQMFNCKGGSRNIIIDGNIFLRHDPDVGDGAIQMGGFTSPNLINGNYEAVDIIARNNLIIASKAAAIEVINTDGAYIYNNLMYDCTGGTLILGRTGNGTGSNGGSRDIYIFNNIFYNSTYGLPRTTGASGTFDNLQHGYNAYYNGGVDRFTPGLYNPKDETGAIFDDAMVSVDTSGDFTSILNSLQISGSSPVIDAGTVPDNSAPGNGVPEDILGNTRPMGGAYDIGPIEQAVAAIQGRVFDRGNDHSIRIYPNPFSTSVEIQVLMRNAECGMLNISVYDIMGRQLVRFDQLRIPHSEFRIRHTWDATYHPEGIYLVKIKAGDRIFTERVTYLK